MSSLNALFLEDNFRFHAFDRSHQVVLVLFALSIVALVLLRRASLAAKRAVLVGIALTVQLTVVVWSAIRLYTGQFNPSVDLPFDICNMTALVWLPLLLYRRQAQPWLFDGMLFTAFPGTIQAFFTPHLYDAFPHVTFLKFWIVHGGIIVGVLAAAILGGQRSSLPLWRAILHFHLFMTGSIFFSFLVSIPLNANFTYSRYTPPTGSLLDYFGPWPLYLFSSQLCCYPVFLINHWIGHAFDAAPVDPKVAKKRN